LVLRVQPGLAHEVFGALQVNLDRARLLGRLGRGLSPNGPDLVEQLLASVAIAPMD
jgi:hypothetical protein